MRTKTSCVCKKRKSENWCKRLLNSAARAKEGVFRLKEYVSTSLQTLTIETKVLYKSTSRTGSARKKSAPKEVRDNYRKSHADNVYA